MPDDAHAAADDDCMALLESAIKHHMRGAGRCRILLVDASIKSGTTMTATIEATKQACENVGVEAIVKSACVIDFPIGGSRTITPDYVGLTGPYHLPFADA
jgi:pyrimidine operon attenuation protein/uracil phosphoribosyltransferase